MSDTDFDTIEWSYDEETGLEPLEDATEKRALLRASDRHTRYRVSEE